MTNRTTAELREAIEKLRSLVSDWRNAETRAGLCADPDDLDLEGLSEAAEEANYCYDMAATHFMLWSEDILDALLPQPPALGGQVCQDAKNKIVAAILRYPPETMTEAERIAGDLLREIVPTLRANLKQEEWIEGRPPEQPEDTAWMVHRDEWRSAKITHFNRDAWYIDGNRYAPHYRFDRYCKPLPTPPQSKKEG